MMLWCRKLQEASVNTKYGVVKAYYSSMDELSQAQDAFIEEFRHQNSHLGYHSLIKGVHRWNRYRRDAKLKASSERITDEEFEVKCELIGYICIFCGKEKPLTRDHLVEISRGGSDAPSNIVPACIECNNSRSRYDGDMEKFLKHFNKRRRSVIRTRLWMLNHPTETKALEIKFRVEGLLI